MNRIRIVLVLTCSVVLSSARAPAITIDTVVVGDAGNAPENSEGVFRGGVPYDYRIGKYEVTVGQYTSFLNSVAATDTYGLYSEWMALDTNIAGIARLGSPGSYTYEVIGSPNKPVSNVSWGDALRFVNWLHNGQPTGLQSTGTTESGAYAVNGATTDSGLNAVTRDAGAKWFLPNPNEWYKAAYYQPASQGGDTDNYWKFATRSNDAPYSDEPPGVDAPVISNTANYTNDDDIDNGYNDGYAAPGAVFYGDGTNKLTDVGAFTAASSYYGTFDQSGNLRELTDGIFDSSWPETRGGSWFNGNPESLRSGLSLIFSPTNDSSTVGFRVAALVSVPEPSSIILVTVAGVGFTVFCRSRHLMRRKMWLTRR